MHLFIQSIEPLYGLATLRSSLVSHLEQHRPKGSAGLDEATASSYGMALKSFGTLFVQLPSEVLEEELERVKDLIRDVCTSPSRVRRKILIMSLAVPLAPLHAHLPSRR